MCGIVGYTGSRPALPILVRALKDLEYRGYDSAGVALLAPSGEGFAVTKREGKIANLESALASSAGELATTTGIGHTRWATHGKPNDRNAHPHLGWGGEVVVIHNGIVENYAALRTEIQAAGHTFSSDTDSETIAHLLEDEVRGGASLLEALRHVSARLEGSQAIVAMSSREPGVLVAARIGNAGGVVLGYGDGEMVVTSDLAAVLPVTRRVAFLADGQLARVDSGGATAIALDGTPVELEVRTVDLDPASAHRGEYPHIMLKEIMDQPEALADTIRSVATIEPPELKLTALGPASEALQRVQRVLLVGMGTSLHAAMIGRRYIEQIAGVAAEVDNASEFRYRESVVGPETLVVSVSQSGETVDVLEAMQIARAQGAPQVTICNTEGAQTTRVADGTVYTRAGLERGVASTKCFTAAVAALYLLALRLAEARGNLPEDDLRQRLAALAHLPVAAAGVLRNHTNVRTVAAELATTRHMLFLGRGLAFPVAMEGALKMKEISYVHAEGYAAGEMKHGPIALIEPGFPTIAIATKYSLRAKMISNIEQVQARGGEVVALATEGDSELPALVKHVLWVPEVAPELEPIVSVLPLQLLSYYVASARGCDIDQPRNLAKTVTVE